MVAMRHTITSDRWSPTGWIGADVRGGTVESSVILNEAGSTYRRRMSR